MSLHNNYYDSDEMLKDLTLLIAQNNADALFSKCVAENHEIVDNEVLGKAFKYCRDCKKEV